MEQEKMTKFNKIFPWYAGLSGDLLFWVAIDTLFLTVVKNFNATDSFFNYSIINNLHSITSTTIKNYQENRKYKFGEIRLNVIVSI